MLPFMRFFAAVPLMALALPAVAAADPLDSLDRFAGTWHSQGTFVDSPYGKAGTADATTTCAWSTSHTFMICQQSVTMSGATTADVAIYTYDADAKVYRFYNVQTNRAVPIVITVDDKSVTYPVSFKNNGRDVTIRTVNVWDSPSLYRWRTEYSNDNGATWVPMASGTSQRQ